MLLKRQYYGEKLAPLKEARAKKEQDLVNKGKNPKEAHDYVLDIMPHTPEMVKGVEAKRVPEVQELSPKYIHRGVAEGWLSMADGKVILKTLNKGDIEFIIARTPGYYCCYCGVEIVDGGTRVQGDKTVGMIHVEENHSGEGSPDITNPHGYTKINSYTLVNQGEAFGEPATKEEAKSYAFELRRRKLANVAPQDWTNVKEGGAD